MKVSSISEEGELCEGLIDLETTNGIGVNNFSVSLGSVFLKQFLIASKFDALKISINEKNMPVVFCSNEMESYWHMLMPVV